MRPRMPLFQNRKLLPHCRVLQKKIPTSNDRANEQWKQQFQRADHGPVVAMDPANRVDRQPVPEGITGKGILCYVPDNSLFGFSENLAIALTIWQLNRCASAKSTDFPVFFPVSRELGPETGSSQTRHTASLTSSSRSLIAHSTIPRQRHQDSLLFGAE